MKEQKKVLLLIACILFPMLLFIGCTSEKDAPILPGDENAGDENEESQIDIVEVLTSDWQYWGPEKKWDAYIDCMGFAYIPDGYQLGAHIQMLDRDILVLIPTLADDDYDIMAKFQDYNQRVVIERHWPNIDTTTLVSWEEIALSTNQAATQYIYGNGNFITYAELPPNVPNVYDQYLEPVEGDHVIEWSTEQFDCRAYGSFTYEEMKKIVEGWICVNN